MRNSRSLKQMVAKHYTFMKTFSIHTLICIVTTESSALRPFNHSLLKSKLPNHPPHHSSHLLSLISAQPNIQNIPHFKPSTHHPIWPIRRPSFYIRMLTTNFMHFPTNTRPLPFYILPVRELLFVRTLSALVLCFAPLWHLITNAKRCSMIFCVLLVCGLTCYVWPYIQNTLHLHIVRRKTIESM